MKKKKKKKRKDDQTQLAPFLSLIFFQYRRDLTPREQLHDAPFWWSLVNLAYSMKNDPANQ